MVELHLVVRGGLVQFRVRLAGDGVHRQGPGVFLGGLRGGGDADGQARRASFPELFQLLGGEGGQVLKGQAGIEGLHVLDHGGLAGGDAGGRGTGGLGGAGRGAGFLGGGAAGRGIVWAEHLPELEAQHQGQKGDGGDQQPAGKRVLTFLRVHGVHHPHVG